ncbi:HAD-IA family hydrolase [Candidatus Woesebacteria bacterium]|nr:MAG: HAD-IA family hydrolase [Candidatus Woesebacteria bacterium]
MIKFVYFDVGGVVIRDFSGTNKWEELKTEMGIKPEQAEEFNEIFDKYEPEVCVGRDVETLVPILRKKLGLELPTNYSFLQDFVSRFEKNESIWSVIEKVKEKYKVGLLTNMYPNMLDEIYKAGLVPDVTWDVVIDSSIEKVRKPQTEIFQLAQERSGFKGEEILFIDNGAKHVDAAKAFGWQGFVYDPNNIEKSNKNLEAIFL